MSTARPGMRVHRMVPGAVHPTDIALGPDHPTLDGLPQLALTASADGVVTEAEWLPGTVHSSGAACPEARAARRPSIRAISRSWYSCL